MFPVFIPFSNQLGNIENIDYYLLNIINNLAQLFIVFQILNKTTLVPCIYTNFINSYL